MLDGVYVIRGASSLSVEEGRAFILGFPVGPGSRVVVPSGRRVPIRAEGLKASILPSSDFLEPYSEEFYEKLDSLAGEIASKNRVMLIGPTDSGKSTMAAWAANKAFLKTGEASLLTTDIGQNEVFCPGFEALATAKPPIIPGYSGSFSKVSPCFVGAFSPASEESRYIKCASRLSGSVEGFLVVDTDGWVSRWRGFESKAALASSIGARVVVALGLSDSWVKAFREVSGTDVISLPRLAPESKSPFERRRHRERLIALRLSGATRRVVSAEDALITGLPVFHGEPLGPGVLEGLAPDPVYAEKTEEGLVIVSRGKPNVRSLHLKPGWERGALAAVYGDDAVYVGLLDKINYRARSITVLTVYQGEINAVEVGSVRVDPDLVTGKAKW